MNSSITFFNINLFPCPPGFHTGKRVLGYPYFLYVHSGCGKFKIGNVLHSGRIGDLFFCPAGIGNAIYADDKNPFVLSGIEFYDNGNPGETEKLPHRVNLSAEPFLTGCIEEMIQEHRLGKSGSAEICGRILNVLIGRCIRMDVSEESRNITDKLLNYIVSNYNKPLTHEKLSSVFSYHKSSINRLLIQATGMSLKQYLIDLRIKKARDYLQWTDKSVVEIAALCGYSEAAYFTRQFREKIGITPLDFRKHSGKFQAEI